MKRRPLRRYVRDFFTNWSEYEAPAGRKVWLGIRNRFVATALLRGCCGHRGEPGC